MQEAIQVLIADDHPIFRKGLKDIMKYDPSISIAGEASNGEEAIALIRELEPEIAILDINMPGKTGLEVARYIYEENLLVKVIILTMSKEEHIFREAVKYGIKGYLLKENAIDEVVNSVKRVAANHTHISPLLSEYLMSIVNEPAEEERMPSWMKELTKTEKKILQQIARQHTSREIAENLFVSIKTVENHRSNICRKLDLRGANSLLMFAIEHKDDLCLIKI